MNRVVQSIIPLTALALLAAHSAIMSPFADAYTLHSLGTGRANDINNAGEIVGVIYTGTSGFPAYTSSFSTPLSAITGLPIHGNEGEAKSISQIGSGTTGQISGWGYRANKFIFTQACLWTSSSASPTALTIAPNSSYDYGMGINSSGLVAGWSDTPTAVAYQWTSTSLLNLAPEWDPLLPPEYHSWAHNINEAGVKVGQYLTAGMNAPSVPSNPTSGMAVIWPASWTSVAVSGPPTLIPMPSGYYISTAYDVNNAVNYKVVGTAGPNYGPPFFTHAFMYDSATGITTDLGALSGDVDSYAYGVNDNGDAVGCSIDGSGIRTAVIWPGGGSPVALATGLGTTLSVATSINNDGDIVGYNDGTGGAAWCLEY